jgi:alkanesulfonate monooxygenase SsuD/methylene tetrahydromethanopterin reductase-like flavin-dependent oxidoreductase (luciferase family)
VNARMTGFHPTLSPRERILRSGLLTDTSLAPRNLIALARVCSEVGIDVLWLDDVRAQWTANRRALLAAAVAVAPAAPALQLGTRIDWWHWHPGLIAGLIAKLGRTFANRIELTISTWDLPDPREELAPSWVKASNTTTFTEYVRAVRSVLEGSGYSPHAPVNMTTQPTLSRHAVKLAAEAILHEDIAGALQVVDDIVIPPTRLDDIGTKVAAVKSLATGLGRPWGSYGLAVTLPLCISSTRREALAVLHRDEAFRTWNDLNDIAMCGPPLQCREIATQLRRWEITDLRCVLPKGGDPLEHIRGLALALSM